MVADPKKCKLYARQLTPSEIGECIEIKFLQINAES